MTETLIIPTLTLIAGFFLGYLTSYFQEKGKNRATIEDTGKITQEQENVLLQSAKRKYQYEDKRTQYFKYFNLLDELTAKQNIISKEKFLPATNEFFSGYFQSKNDDKKKQSIVKYSEAVNNLMFEANLDYIKLKGETNSLKLIAAPKVEKLLIETEIAYNNAFEESSEIMKDFCRLMIEERTDIIQLKQNQLKITGENLMSLKSQLIAAMKDELNEI